MLYQTEKINQSSKSWLWNGI